MDMKTHIAAPNLMTLLQYEDGEFIEHAYYTLLKRLPDEGGFNHYLKLLRGGVSKIRILDYLRKSPEALACGVMLPGLHRAVILDKLFSIPVWGRLANGLNRQLDLMGADRTHEYQLWLRLEEEARERTKIQQSLNDLKSLIVSRNPMTSFPVAEEVTPPPSIESMAINKTVRLDNNYSIDELGWLAYLEELFQRRLIRPLQAAGTPPPKQRFVVVVDCMSEPATRDGIARTGNSLAALITASEYDVNVYWLGLPDKSDDSSQALPGEVLNYKSVKKLIKDNDLVLILRPGDEVRPEIHMALKFFNAFQSDFTIIDGYFRDDGRIYPWLQHAVDPVHAGECDYFLGRYCARGKVIKAYAETSGVSGLSPLGRIICSQISLEMKNQHCHIALPLLCLNYSREQLAKQRDEIIYNPKPVAPSVTSSGPRRNIGAAQKTVPSISVVICTKDAGLLLRQLLNRLDREVHVKEIIVVSNNTSNIYAIGTLKEAQSSKKITILEYNNSFNFSKQCNLGAKHSTGDVLLFLNDDVCPVSNDWIERMLYWMDGRRIVGATLIYPNQTIQHAGMHLGYNGCAGHLLRFAQMPQGDCGFFLVAPRRVSCLTGAAMMMPRGVFESLNGFDPLLAMFYQDVDLSLRALNSGVDLIFEPRAILIHMESVSVVPTLQNVKVSRSRQAEYEFFKDRWSEALADDAWINPLFDPMDESLTMLRF